MKKTIAILCTLCAAAQADIVFDYAITGSGTDAKPTLTATKDGVDISSSVTGKIDIGAQAGTIGSGCVTNGNAVTNGTFVSDCYFVTTNVGEGGTWTATFTFSLDEAVSLTELNVGIKSGNANGGVQTNPRTPEITYTLTQTDALPDTWTNATDSINTQQIPGTSRNGVDFVFSDINKQLNAGNYELTISVKNASTAGGFYLALQDVTLSTSAVTLPVPEPTTATLSLLALAGLAARRRRK